MGGVTVKDVTAVHQPRVGTGAPAKRRSASRDKRAKLALKILLPLAAVLWLFRMESPGHVVPIWGPSMRPTMAVWNLPSPLESLSFSGWVHYDPDREPEIGNIVYFKVPNTRFREVKRVAKINESGDLWVTPDNSGVSGEGSDNSELYDWVPRDSVKGVVDNIYTPARFFRIFTLSGRLRNWVEMEYSPEKRFLGAAVFVVRHSPDYFVVLDEGNVVLIRGDVVRVDAKGVQFEVDGRLFVYSVKKRTAERVRGDPFTLSAEFDHKFSPSVSVGIEGNVTDLVSLGSAIEVDRGETPSVTFKVERIHREGSVTVVEGGYTSSPPDFQAIL
jgi:RNase P/RNase MRP subunit p29